MTRLDRYYENQASDFNENRSEFIEQSVEDGIGSIIMVSGVIFSH